MYTALETHDLVWCEIFKYILVYQHEQKVEKRSSKSFVIQMAVRM
jgi:hypothetical protein